MAQTRPEEVFEFEFLKNQNFIREAEEIPLRVKHVRLKDLAKGEAGSASNGKGRTQLKLISSTEEGKKLKSMRCQEVELRTDLRSWNRRKRKKIR